MAIADFEGVLHARRVLVEFHRAFRSAENDEAVRELVAQTSKFLGWDSKGAHRATELLFEVGLITDKGGTLLQLTFIKFASALHTHGFIPTSLRPKPSLTLVT